MADMVNHPPHYQTETGLEAIEVIRAFFRSNYNLGQVFKYIARCGKKLDDIEDLKKARWYLDKEIEWREGSGDTSPAVRLMTQEEVREMMDRLSEDETTYAPYGDEDPEVGDEVQIKAACYDDSAGVIVSIRNLTDRYPYEVKFGDRDTFFAKDELWVRQ